MKINIKFDEDKAIFDGCWLTDYSGSKYGFMLWLLWGYYLVVEWED